MRPAGLGGRLIERGRRLEPRIVPGRRTGADKPGFPVGGKFAQPARRPSSRSRSGLRPAALTNTVKRWSRRGEFLRDVDELLPQARSQAVGLLPRDVGIGRGRGAPARARSARTAGRADTPCGSVASNRAISRGGCPRRGSRRQRPAPPREKRRARIPAAVAPAGSSRVDKNAGQKPGAACRPRGRRIPGDTPGPPGLRRCPPCRNTARRMAYGWPGNIAPASRRSRSP